MRFTPSPQQGRGHALACQKNNPYPSASHRLRSTLSPQDDPLHAFAPPAQIAEARTAKRGLWTDANPIPPWEWRKGQRASSTAASAPAAVSPPAEPVIGNRRSNVYHWPGCPDYDKVSTQNRVTFPSCEAAEQAGYRPAGNCR